MEELIKIPEKWHNCRITDVIGHGSYGSVLKARFAEENGKTRPAAIKVITVPKDDAERAAVEKEYPDEGNRLKYYRSIVAELKKEIEAMSLLDDCTNIVRLEDYIIEEHKEPYVFITIYIRMELLKTFEEYAREHLIDEAEVSRMAVQLCSALEMCQEKGILHRDIKPENIMVTDDGTYKLGDFGIAKQMDSGSMTSSIRGSYACMAPEVYMGQKYDMRADQYSLGIVMYRLMNKGRDPFVDTDKQIVFHKDRERALKKRMEGEVFPPPVNASESFGKIIRKACSFKPENRYEDIRHLKDDLIRLQNGDEPDVPDLVNVSEKVRNEQIKREKSKKKALKIMAGVVIASAVLGLAAFSQLRKSGKDLFIEEARAAEDIIMDEGVHIDDMLVMHEAFADTKNYQTGINDPDDPVSSSALAGLSEFAEEKEEYDHSESFLVYLDHNYCVGEILYYSVVIDRETEREWVKSSSELYYLERGSFSDWKLCDQDDTDTVDQLIYEKYLPGECLEAVRSGRNYKIYNNSFWTGKEAFFEDAVNMDTAAVWQNEDGSADAYIICRNGTQEPQSEYSCWIRISDDELGDIILARGKLNNIAVPAGEARAYIAHFDAKDVITGSRKWSDNVTEYTAGKNSNDTMEHET